MKHTSLLLLIIFWLSLISVDSRGGRGRGGFGGIFGNWRKHKSKLTISRNSGRSSSNGMPTHSTISKSMTSKPHFIHKQQLNTVNTPYKGNNFGRGASIYSQNPYGYNTPQLPPGGAYYANHASIPAGAVYIPHTPPYSHKSTSSDFTDFFMGYMTGRLLTNGMTYNHHVHHIYPQQVSQAHGKEIIIIESGTNSHNKSEKFWPTDTDVPLFPFNSTLTSEEIYKSNKEPIFKRVLQNNNTYETTELPRQEKNNNNTDNLAAKTSNGIICMPMIFNETDVTDHNKVIQVEKLVCYPAPPPPLVTQDIDGNNCVIRTFIETNPNNSSETIEVTRKHCSTATTERSEPVVGDIHIDPQEETN